VNYKIRKFILFVVRTCQQSSAKKQHEFGKQEWYLYTTFIRLIIIVVKYFFSVHFIFHVILFNI